MEALFDLLRETLRNPQAGARQVMALQLSLAERWQAFVLVAVVSAILAQIIQLLVPLDEGAAMGLMLGTPVQTGLVQAAVLFVTMVAVHVIGRMFGGVGSWPDALLLVVWLEMIMIALQAVQTLAILILPPLGWVIGLAGLGLFLWLLTHFTVALHRFRSPVRVFWMIVVSLFVLAFGLAIVLALIGVSLPTEG